MKERLLLELTTLLEESDNEKSLYIMICFLLLSVISDINECVENNGGCSDECINTRGSFECKCPNGYTLDLDMKTCIGIRGT